MKPKHQFREANIEDLAILCQWTLDLMAHEAVDESLELPLNSDLKNKIANWLRTLIESENALFIVAIDDNETPCGCVLGMLQMAPNDFVDFNMHGLVQMIWVEPEYRRHGIAQQLLQHMEQTFTNLDVPFCEISYSVTNQEAESFWHDNGYKPVSKTCRKFL